MDQKRFIAFLMLSMAVLMLSSLLFPPPRRPKPAGPADAPVAGQDQPAVDGGQHVADQQPPTEDEQPDAEPAADAAVPAVPPDSAEPLQYITLGSLDPHSGYRMLVTLTNRGAAVHRVELSSPRFRDQHDRSGYLGHLALEELDGDGLRVRAVGKGTPAAEAGVQVDDLVVGIGQGEITSVHTVNEFTAALSKTRPGKKVTLQVKRGDGPAQPMVVALGRRPLEVMRPEIENIHMRGAEPPVGFVDVPSFLLTMSAGGKLVDRAEASQSLTVQWLQEGTWQIVQHDESSVAFRRQLGPNLEITKRYTLEAVPESSRDDDAYPGYDIRLDIELRNIGSQPQPIAYQLSGPTGLPLEGWWYSHKISQRWFSAAGLRDVAVRFHEAPEVLIDCPKIANDDVEPMGQGRPLCYAGVDGQYFAAMLIPHRASLEENWFDATEAIRVGPKPDPRTPAAYTNVTCRLTRTVLDLPPGESLSDSYEVFIGPKRPELLAQYQAAGDPNYSLKDLLYYGWFGTVARTMVGILHFFYGLVGNYGIAIIMLTVLVRGAMFPISYKQTQNMARMQALKPELDRITEKYRTDMQKRQQAMQEVYRKHNINPLGGCLPLFIQLPIFIGLYRSLMVDVELRQSPLFGHWIRWCSNLAAPDMLLDWSAIMPQSINDGVGIFGLGPYLNILPLVTVALFLVTQKMAMPPAANEQAAMQQKMMKYMTALMGLLFYKVASGLCLYFIASSLWGIAERKLLPKSQSPAGTVPATPADKSTTARETPSPDSNPTGKNGSPGKQVKAKRKR